MYETTANYGLYQAATTQTKSVEKLFDLIAKSEIGNDKIFSGPFGKRRICYCDYTASGRPLTFIEDFIRNQVLTSYANTHSNGIYNAGQISDYREDARKIIKNSVNSCDDDNVIFVGSGSTGAAHKLIGIMDIKEPLLVIVSPYEHHSNLLPWKELGAEILFASDSPNSCIDLEDLENKLKKYKNDKRLKIGTFAAASNVTGCLLDTEEITILLHKYGFLSFWDYSTAASHVKIDMNPKNPFFPNSDLAFKDAIFFSGHKFVGGPQTPGVLIAKKKLFKNKIPHQCGGGTVHYVTKTKHCYLEDNEEREEGGTPAIIESIRLGLVFQLKEALDEDKVRKREQFLVKKGLNFLSKIPNLHLLGNCKLERLPIFTFIIRNEETGYYLHHNFVTALLNDLFGIQSRSGCACAGPYGQYLLGISDELFDDLIQILYTHDDFKTEGRVNCTSNELEIFKPGFTRFSLCFFFDDAKVDFILNAIKFVAKYGWKFLPSYDFDIATGEWKHKNLQEFDDKKSLFDINYNKNTLSFEPKTNPIKEMNLFNPISFIECLYAAYRIMNSLHKKNILIHDQRITFNSNPKIKRMRWWVLPSEAYGILQNKPGLYNKIIHEPLFKPLTDEDFRHKSYETSSTKNEKYQKEYMYKKNLLEKINNAPRLVEKIYDHKSLYNNYTILNPYAQNKKNLNPVISQPNISSTVTSSNISMNKKPSEILNSKYTNSNLLSSKYLAGSDSSLANSVTKSTVSSCNTNNLIHPHVQFRAHIIYPDYDYSSSQDYAYSLGSNASTTQSTLHLY